MNLKWLANDLKYLDLQVNLGWGFTKQASVWGCFGISWIFLAEAKYRGGEEEEKKEEEEEEEEEEKEKGGRRRKMGAEGVN